jgi:hypothetical protein
MARPLVAAVKQSVSVEVQMNLYRVTTTQQSYWMWRVPTWLGRIISWWRGL